MSDIIKTERELPANPVASSIAHAIEAAAALGKEGVEVLERLHALQKDERAAEAKRAFVRGMARVRAELPPIVKTATGQHGAKRDGTRTKGLYAPLDTITPILDPIAARHGFSYRFDREVVPGREDDYMVCIVTHEQGHEERTKYPCPTGEGNRGTNKLQSIAVGESYAKRYSLVAAFGITTADPDDDAQSWSDDPGDTITGEQVLHLESVAEPLTPDEWAAFLRWMGVAKAGEIPSGRFGEALAGLTKKVKAKK